LCLNPLVNVPHAQKDTILQTVLLIEADPTCAAAISRALTGSSEEPFRIEWVRLLSEGIARLARDAERPREQPASAISAVLADLFLLDSRGIETFDQLLLAVPQIPILILVDAADESIAKHAVQRGAQEYLLKTGLDNYLLPKTLRSMIERATIAEALFEEKERAQVTLNSIGDAVMSTDVHGQVTYLNTVAEYLTGWLREEAIGKPVSDVFRIVDSTTRNPVENPMGSAVRDNMTVGLTANCLLIRRDGIEAAIEDSAAPIHDRRGHVTGAVIVFHDVSATRALSLKMSHLAQHDSLTDLPNRLLLNDRLTQAMIHANRFKKRLAILFLDLDRFKHINDSLGHVIGDRLLQSVAQRLLSCVRGSDTVSRQGGDEFVILLSEVTHAQDAAVCAEKIIQVLGAPHRIAHHDIHITASIGISTFPNDGKDREILVQQADFAMYHAKESGRNNCQFFKPEMNVKALQRRSLEGDLRGATERGEFELYYQPKVNLRSGNITGVEALIRWRQPNRGLVMPSNFISTAEECGFITMIGRWVLRTACRQAMAWQSAGLPPIQLAVNISAAELRAKDFVTGVRTILAETGLAPRYLELELTETYLLQNAASTATVLRALKQLGVRLALDDFGTGYSSLSHLRRFPIDILKIDRSFVGDLTADAGDASIVSAVISMGKSLHMVVVAEGVETAEQLAFLQNNACPEGQGYYFSQAVPAPEFMQLLERNGRAPRLRERR
jgi:diguanylate cyclase (GGDEF)-like protein/PAS domain S-box-containing protein